MSMSGPNSPNLNPLDLGFGVNAGVLSEVATEAKTSSRVLKCTLVNLIWVTRENHWQRCKDYHKRNWSECRYVCQPTVDIL